MRAMAQGRALVLFGNELPRERGAAYSVVIAHAALEPDTRACGLAFEALEGFVDPGSVVEAAAFAEELAQVMLPSGTRVSDSILYHGYKLWWINYDELYYRQCIPYTQYRRLLEHLAGFSHVTLVTPPASGLFRSYLGVHGCAYQIVGGAKRFPSIGIWLQVLISLISLPLLMLKRPGLLVYTGDLFDPPRDYSFRMHFIYQELRGRKVPFVEFIRSLEPTCTMLAHAWKRRRPVIYSYAIKVVLSWMAGSGGRRALAPASGDPAQAFKLALASLYVPDTRAITWSIRAMNFLARIIGVRAALIPAGGSRTFHEILGCKLAGVPTIGILHGAPSRYYNAYDFMPGFTGEKMLSVDIYGVWSEWWREQYIRYSRAYKPEQLRVSGPMRPLLKQGGATHVPETREGLLKILFISEQSAAPEEIMPYLSKLLADSRLELYFKFRSYRDGFEEWLKVHHPEILERVGTDRILYGTMQEAIAHCHVTVGSYSTAVLEALLQEKPPVFFNTRKWGDCYGLAPLNTTYGIFATSPEQLVEYVVRSTDAPRETLKELQQMFFGDPHKNGSAWLVDQLEEVLRKRKGLATK